MTPSEEAKISKILELMEERKLIVARAEHLLDQLEKELRIRLNENWTTTETQVQLR